MQELNLAAITANLNIVLDFINKQLEAANFSVKQIMQIDIAVEEIYVNIADYAYRPDTGNVNISFDLTATGAVIEFSDTGTPYDPLNYPDPDITATAESRQAGGLGIFMAKKLMDHITYTHRDGKNILVIEKFYK